MKSKVMRRAGLVTAAFANSCLVAGCGKPLCNNEVIRGIPSPDGADIAFVFRRNCDATPGWTTHVSVMDIHRPLRDERGNVLIVGGTQSLKVSWLGPRRLLVTSFKEPVNRKVPQINMVTVEFRSTADK